jgi:ABC-type sugar transport system ATPase subunit
MPSYLSVYDNIAYGLRARKIPKLEIAERIDRIIAADCQIIAFS